MPSDTTIAVIGAGTMGAGIAQVAAQAGHEVLLYDATDGAVEHGLARVAKGLARQVERGRMTDSDRNALLARIHRAGDFDDMAPAGLVIEAIIEDLAVKQEVFKKLESICSENAILATNTSSLSITAIGAALQRPERLVGMHFFNPAPVMKLVEVVSGAATGTPVAAAVHATAAAWGKSPVHARSSPGFIVNRVARPFYAEALRLLETGAAEAATIDAVMRESGGFRMGPFELMDLIGNDVNFAVTRSVYEGYFHDPRFKPSLLQQELVTAGHLGRKNGRGFYDYAEDSETPRPATAEPAPRPDSVTLHGDLGPADTLATLIREAGINIETRDGPGLIQCGSACLALTDGRYATARCAGDGLENLVTFDLAADYREATRIALAPADQASAEALRDASGLFQALGKQVSVIDDYPGMIVMRTVCMLVNEAADAVDQRVGSAADVDTAMRQGLNYPRGPLAWGDVVGVAEVLAVTGHLASTYGEDRYRSSPLLRRKAAAGRGISA
ncbi:MAG TPA: 3-hydroxyacyl-CoA dehydrogenase PaaH [Arenicellales bacterium]|nr:3-hydroxyacyl-CoA dehydrogenase PaaH [Arenicellales bacterium]